MTFLDIPAFEYWLSRKACINEITFDISHYRMIERSILTLNKHTAARNYSETYVIIWDEVKNIETYLNYIFENFRIVRSAIDRGYRVGTPTSKNTKSTVENTKTTTRATPVEPVNFPKIKDVIFNPPATIILWSDGTKTVVKSTGDDVYDPEKGLAMSIAKRALGNSSGYYEIFKKWLAEYEPKQNETNKLEKAWKEFISSFNTNFSHTDRTESTDRSCKTCWWSDNEGTCHVPNKDCVDLNKWEKFVYDF